MIFRRFFVKNHSSNDKNSESRVKNLTPQKTQEVGKMKTIATVLVMLLAMPVSYAMLDEAMRKLRIKNRMGS